ncbi:hypothetical protein [Halomicrococcus gelatinilyticus]|uniref:hypothetical protein n=1 Tax=Halomicrococcus gelatinilyticus TaxID=1702103 RepID=UPI002E15C978
MTKDTPQRERSVRERGTYAKHGDDPTLASYVSSLLYVLSVPALLLVTYAGYWYDVYGYGMLVPVFAGLLVGTIAVALAVMHLLTR